MKSEFLERAPQQTQAEPLRALSKKVKRQAPRATTKTLPKPTPRQPDAMPPTGEKRAEETASAQSRSHTHLLARGKRDRPSALKNYRTRSRLESGSSLCAATPNFRPPVSGVCGVRNWVLSVTRPVVVELTRSRLVWPLARVRLTDEVWPEALSRYGSCGGNHCIAFPLGGELGKTMWCAMAHFLCPKVDLTAFAFLLSSCSSSLLFGRPPPPFFWGGSRWPQKHCVFLFSVLSGVCRRKNSQLAIWSEYLQNRLIFRVLLCLSLPLSAGSAPLGGIHGWSRTGDLVQNWMHKPLIQFVNWKWKLAGDLM